RPAPLEQPLRGEAMAGLEQIASLRVLHVQQQLLAAVPALEGGHRLPLVREEVLARGEQERTEAALVPADVGEEVPLEEAAEELLGEVVGLVGGVAAPPHVGVQRIPIPPAEIRQGLFTFAPAAVACAQDQAPLGGSKPPRGGGGDPLGGGHCGYFILSGERKQECHFFRDPPSQTAAATHKRLEAPFRGAPPHTPAGGVTGRGHKKAL